MRASTGPLTTFVCCGLFAVACGRARSHTDMGRSPPPQGEIDTRVPTPQKTPKTGNYPKAVSTSVVIAPRPSVVPSAGAVSTPGGAVADLAWKRSAKAALVVLGLLDEQRTKKAVGESGEWSFCAEPTYVRYALAVRAGDGGHVDDAISATTEALKRWPTTLTDGVLCVR